MGKEKVFLRRDHHFCDPFLKGDLYWLEEDDHSEEDKDMKQDRSSETECPSFEFGTIFKDRANLLFLF